MLVTSISLHIQKPLLLSLDSFRRIFPGVSVSMNQACSNKTVILAETDLLKKVAKLYCATYLTASARMGTARKGSITARTWLDNSTNRARKLYGSGTKSVRFGLERISSWARNWHDLARKRHHWSSKQARYRLENGTIWARSWHANNQRQGSKISKFGAKNRDTTKNIIKSKIIQIRRLHLEHMIYGIL